MRRHELAGKRFTRLTAIEYVPSTKIKKDGKRREGKWKCICDCGMITMATGGDLVSGRKKSCGCLLKEGQNGATHGFSKKERLYNIWCAMKQRCYYAGYQHSKNYMEKGITVCEEWRNDYLAFRTWAMSHGYHEQPKDTEHGDVLSIDRIDPSKGYSPENCQWITCAENLRKRFSDAKKGGGQNTHDSNRKAERETEAVLV